MATPNYLPQGERLLEGTITSGQLTAVATSCDVSNPPAADKLPTYFEFEPDNTDNRETVRVYDVSSSTIYFDRGVYDGGVGKIHAANSAYKQKLTSKHWDAVVDAMTSSFLPEDASFTITRDSDTQFTISNIDRTAYYTAGRIIRFNGSSANIAIVSSSTLSSADTVVTIDSTYTIPATLTTVEIAMMPVGATNFYIPKSDLLDEDDMASDSATKPPSQQSVKAYVDSGTVSMSNKTLVSPTISSPTITGTPVLNADSAVPFYNSSMSRQAIMNGNFDVWQRGTSVAVPQTTVTFEADRWFDYSDDDGGTAPTLTRSRQILTSGAIANAFYYARLNANGAGSSLGAGSVHNLTQRIEHATRMLCGDGKKVTVSFWAKSDIADKKIGLYLTQYYGSTGSPSATEIITGTNWTLTSSWTKYTHTFTTNTLSGKTFGTDNNDYMTLNLVHMWGTGTYGGYVDSSGVAEDYGGSGNIEVAQVQLCAGEVALPFQPKSFDQELELCQRYYQKSFVYNTAPADAAARGYQYTGTAYATTAMKLTVNLFERMRTTPTVVVYRAGSDGTVAGRAGYFNGSWVSGSSADTLNYGSENAFTIIVNTSGLTPYASYMVSLHWTAEAEP